MSTRASMAIVKTFYNWAFDQGQSVAIGPTEMCATASTSSA